MKEYFTFLLIFITAILSGIAFRYLSGNIVVLNILSFLSFIYILDSLKKDKFNHTFSISFGIFISFIAINISAFIFLLLLLILPFVFFIHISSLFIKHFWSLIIVNILFSLVNFYLISKYAFSNIENTENYFLYHMYYFYFFITIFIYSFYHIYKDSFTFNNKMKSFFAFIFFIFNKKIKK
jgi:hypothetical protein